MRILVVADYYRHGTGRVVEERAADLVRRGHAVSLLAGTDAERLDLESEFARGRGLSPALLPYAPGRRGPVELFRLSRAFRARFESLVRSRRFDVLLLNQPLSAWPILSSPLGKALPSLYTFHSPWSEEWRIAHQGTGGLARVATGWVQRAARNWIEDRALRCASAVTLLSGFMREELRRHHPAVDTGKIALIPGGVETGRFHPRPQAEREGWRTTHGIPLDAPLLFTVRRLVPRMGLDLLLDAFAQLRRTVPSAYLACGGAGPLAAALRERARTLGVAEQVRFLGYVSEEELPLAYASADLFVLPTLSLEGFGLVTIEALASGVPVVATPVGASSEILAPIDPLLIALDVTPSALCEAIMRTLSQSADERAAIGSRAMERVHHLYDAERVGERLEELLARVSGAPVRESEPWKDQRPRSSRSRSRSGSGRAASQTISVVAVPGRDASGTPR